MKIADLFAEVGFRINQRQQKKVDSALNNTLRGMKRGLAAVGGFYAFKAAGKALLGFNDNLEQAKIQMAGLLQLNTGGEFNDQLKVAGDLVERLQQRAKKSVGTTKDMVDMAAMITRPVTAAGLGMQELEDITANAVVAARAFGIESGQAALDIEQALMGTLGKKDRFARALLEPMKLNGKKFDTKTFNALSAKKRAEFLSEAFNQEGIVKMAEAQASSFSGLWSTAMDSLQMTLGKIGKPLFEAITKELQRLTEWIDKNPEKIEKFAKTFADGLITIFKIAKTVLVFVYDHWKLILTLLVSQKIARGLLMLSARMGVLGTTSLKAGMQAATGWAAGLAPILILTTLVAGLLWAAKGFWDFINGKNMEDTMFGQLTDQAADYIMKLDEALGLTKALFNINYKKTISKEAHKRRRDEYKAYRSSGINPRAEAAFKRRQGVADFLVGMGAPREHPMLNKWAQDEFQYRADRGGGAPAVINIHAGNAGPKQVADEVAKRLNTKTRNVPSSRRVREPSR